MKGILVLTKAPRCNDYLEACTVLSRRLLTTWKPFSLENELTLDVKKSIERKWAKDVYGIDCPAELQRQVKRQGIGTEKSYILSMFPYPSGKLHLGHVRIYTLSDVLARYHRLKGEEVAHPIGWDAFGLPAENAARDNGIEPEKWTRDNIEFMKEQILRMGCVFDWDREFATCDPTYYKWTQWLFLKLWEQGLAYKKRAYVFWDPVDQTVLAEEQVDSEMCSWRSGAKVEKRLLDQWFIRTSVFAKQLTDTLGTNTLRQGWRDIVDLQKHWIGPIEGYFTDCPIITNSTDPKSNVHGEFLRLWFSSPDVLKAAKFVILQPNHYLNHSEMQILQTFSNDIKQLNVFIQNPISGAPLPVFSGSIDLNLPLVPESSDCRVNELLSEDRLGELAAQEDQMYQVTCNLSTAYKYQGKLKSTTKFQYFPSSLKLRDWLISRQRKWGTPIPAILCQDCSQNSTLRVEDLPVLHENVTEYPICHKNSLPKCPSCGSSNTRLETDTLDTFFDSSWYFLRYLDPHNTSEIFNPEKLRPWLPVRTYIGGKEHAILHLYYARFMSHFLHSIGLLPEQEPFKVLVPVGIVLGETFLTKAGKYLQQDQVEENELKNIVEKGSGSPVTVQWEKMSKSKHNGIDPDGALEEYGVDSLRLLSMADVAPQSTRKWPSQSLNTFLKFQNKVWCTVQDFVAAKESEEDIIQYINEDNWQKMEDEIFDVRNYHLKSVTYNMEITSQISVAITKLQGITTGLRKVPKAAIKDSFQFERALGTLLIALYPILPAFTAQLWQYFRDVANLTDSEFDLHNEVWCQKWPEVDQDYKLDLIVNYLSEELDTLKVARQTLDGIDKTIALELALENEKIGELVSRESVKIISFKLEPGYRAILNIMDVNNPEITVNLKKKAKLQKKSKRLTQTLES